MRMEAQAQRFTTAEVQFVASGPSTRKIRVLHLIYSPGYGGIESAVINWVTNLDSERFEVHIAYFAGDRNREIPFLQAARAAGLSPLPVPWSRYKPFLRCAREVARIVREKEIDILHTHAYYGDAVGAITGRLVKVRTVATVYVWGRYELHRQLMQFIDWLSIQFFDHVTAHCQDTASKTFVLGKSRSEIPILLPGYPIRGNHLSPAERANRRRALGVADDEILLINAARLAPEKAQDQLLRSFRQVLDAYPKSRLWICGVGMESVETQLRRMILELGLEGAAKLMGFREDYRETLQLADLMMHPAHVEGMPLALLGAAEAGLAIVASNVGGVSEIIDHGRTGFLVAENDWRDFAERVKILAGDPNLRAEMGRAAQHRIHTVLSMETAIRKVEAAYLNMMQDQSINHQEEE